LFPSGVVATEMREPGDESLLHPSEALSVSRAVPKRVHEFAAGRLCARLAMAAFGVHDFALRAAPDRRPLWPEALVGSISHTTGLCVAAVADRQQFFGLGLDCEIVEHVTRDLWPSILTPDEAAWVDALQPGEQTAGAALVFAAKEAFYKCQHPLTDEWLDFHDLSVVPRGWGEGGGEFMIRATRPLAAAAFAAEPIIGRYGFDDRLVLAGVAFSRPSPTRVRL
jgi:4'-phosphopantetheinyl transferase EntD